MNLKSMSYLISVKTGWNFDRDNTNSISHFRYYTHFNDVYCFNTKALSIFP